MWQFGFETKWSPLALQNLPLVANCLLPCPQFSGDPYPGQAKTLVVQKQAQAFTVSWFDSTGSYTTTIPALPVSQVANQGDTAAVAQQSASTSPVTLPSTNVTITVPKNGGKVSFVIPGSIIPAQTVTVPGQTAPVTRHTFPFSCTGPDLQHMTCTEEVAP